MSLRSRTLYSVAGLLLLAGVALSAAWLLGYFPNHVDDLEFVALRKFVDDKRDNLQLTFHSNTNLRALGQQSGAYGAYANFSLCPFHLNPWVSIGRVDHNGVDLAVKPSRGCTWRGGKFAGCSEIDNTPEVRAEVAGTTQTKGPFFYTVNFGFYEQWLTYDSHGGISDRRIPLPRGPQELCVKLHGDGGPPGYVSNVFVVPKSAVATALGKHYSASLGPASWLSDARKFACSPSTFGPGQKLVLKLGRDHGALLWIHRLSDDTWFSLINDSPPDDMTVLMTPRDYYNSTRVTLGDSITGYRWYSSRSGQEKIFTTPGRYVVFSSIVDNMNKGFGCEVSFRS